MKLSEKEHSKHTNQHMPTATRTANVPSPTSSNPTRRKPKIGLLNHETPEKRMERLEKQRKRSAARRQNESEEQRRRRLAANRIRGKLRRMEWNNDNREEREKLFEQLCSLPGYRYRGWKNETRKETEVRLEKDLDRWIKNKVKKQLDSDLAIAKKMVTAMKSWEDYEKELIDLLFTIPYKKGQNKTYHECLKRDLTKARGMLFSIDTALATFEKKHSLTPLGRVRPKWMITPPAKDEPSKQSIRVISIELKMRPRKRWIFKAICGELTVFKWHPATDKMAGEWKPSGMKNTFSCTHYIDACGNDYEFTEMGFRLDVLDMPDNQSPPPFGDSFRWGCDKLCSGPSSEVLDYNRKVREGMLLTTYGHLYGAQRQLRGKPLLY